MATPRRDRRRAPAADWVQPRHLIVQRRHGDPERQLALMLNTTTLKHQQTRPHGTLAHGAQKRALTDPRLAQHPQHPHSATADLIQRTRDHRKLPIAPNQLHPTTIRALPAPIPAPRARPRHRTPGRTQTTAARPPAARTTGGHASNPSHRDKCAQHRLAAGSSDGTVTAPAVDIGHFTSGVTVITATDGERDQGMTASAVTSLSLEPQMMLVCLNNQSTTQEAITRSRAFAISVLAEGQHDLATQFARPADDRFAGGPIARGLRGQPLIRDALAVLECKVSNDVVGGTHRVFLARVLRATARPGTPLAYFRGTFGRVELDLNARALDFVRHRVLTRQCALDRPIDVGTLSKQLELPQQLRPPGALDARRRGAGGHHHEERGFVVTAVDRRMVEHAFRARNAIELGGAELTVGGFRPPSFASSATARGRRRRWSPEQSWSTWPRTSRRTRRSTSTSSGADSDALVEAYRRLSLPALMASLLTGYARAQHALSREHLALVDAYEAGSLDEVRRAISAHNDHAQAISEAAVLAGGGRI